MDIHNIPKGLRKEPFIRSLLSRFLDKIDKKQKHLSVRISLGNTPELYAFNDIDTEYLWSLVYDELYNTYKMINIKLKQKKVNDVIYDQAQ